MSNGRAAVDEISIRAAFHLENIKGLLLLETYFCFTVLDFGKISASTMCGLREIHQNILEGNLIQASGMSSLGAATF